MSIQAGAVGRVLRLAAIATVAAFGLQPASADVPGTWPGLERPVESVLSGLRDCGDALGEGMPQGSNCLLGRSVDRFLLDALTRLADRQGQEAFGERFGVFSSMSYAPSGNGLAGGVDVVLPLMSSPSSGAGPESDAFFLQQGVTRWVDGRGTGRHDIRLGAVRRFDLADTGAQSGVLGISGFVQQSHEYRHTRLVAGGDYAGKWGRGSLNLFVPTTGWRPAHTGNEERALAGLELGLRFDLTSTLSMRTAVSRWEDDDGLGGWSTDGRMAVGWSPHPWLDFDVAWNGLGRAGSDHVFRFAFSMPLGERRRPPAWQGLGLVGGNPPPAVDPWSPVDNIAAIRVASRRTATTRPGASVRFLRDSAYSGDRIGLEVTLPAAARVDTDVVIALAPGPGGTPAIAGVDYVDEPIRVTIPAGRSSAVVTVQLPLNSGLDEARSLSATARLAS